MTGEALGSSVDGPVGGEVSVLVLNRQANAARSLCTYLTYLFATVDHNQYSKIDGCIRSASQGTTTR